MMETMKLFVQGEGLAGIRLVELSAEATIGDLLAATEGLGISGRHPVLVLLEDEDREIGPDSSVRLTELGIGHRSRIHCHRCRKVTVTVNFNARQLEHLYSPAATIHSIKQWADTEFHLSGTDATEHALQLCGTSTRPSDDVHVGTLVTFPDCKVCFDLVPKVRVEG